MAVNELEEAFAESKLKFTLDGRFIGDLGELIAAYFFAIELNPGQHKGHDARLGERDVEIKLRRNSTQIWFDSEPTLLIVFRMESCDTRVTLVYAGPGSVIRENIRHSEALHAADGRSFTERQTVSLNQLAEHFDYDSFMQSPTIPFRNHPFEKGRTLLKTPPAAP